METKTVPAKHPNKQKLIILLVAVVGLAISATAGAAYFMKEHKEGPPIPVVQDPIFIALEPMTVNLQPTGRTKFLHVGITLKVADARSQAQINQYLPEVRSRILTVLTNLQAENLLTSEDKALLSSEISKVVARPFAMNLAAANISSTMFTTFLLQ